MIEEIRDGDAVMALILRRDYKADGIKFLTPDSYSQQLGYMNRPEGYVIKPHVHNLALREVHYTNEVLFIKSGKVRVDFYGTDQQYRESRREAVEYQTFAARYKSLTPRERQVLALLVRGLLNKQVGFELGITEYTVQIHRASIMRKIEADSFAVLVRLATKFTVEPSASAVTTEMASPEKITRSETKKVRAAATG